MCPSGVWWHRRENGDFCCARVKREQSGNLPRGRNTYNEFEGHRTLWQVNKKKSIPGKGTPCAKEGSMEE